MQSAYDQPRANDIVFIFNNVKDYQQLVAAVRPGVEVHVLDSSQDGLVQMAAIVDGRSGIDAVHIVSHGGAGELNLGALTLGSANLGDHANVLGKIGGALAAGGDILLYGCDVASGTAGASFVDQLALATGADIAASTNATGASFLGGDWVLEYSHGQVAGTHALDMEAVQGLDTLLALPSNGIVNISDNDVAAKNATVNIDGGWFTMTPTAQLITDPDPADGVYMHAGTADESITITAAGFDTFDLTGMTWLKYYDTTVPGYVGNFTFTITGYKFDHSANVTTTFNTVDLSQTYSSGDYSQFKNLSGFTIRIQAGAGSTNPSSNTFDYFSIANVDHVPTVASSSTSISVSQGTSAFSLNSQLVASDSDSGQTLTWTQATAPAHGTLGFSGATASAGSNVTPGGSVTYTPTSGYAGTDSFAVQVSDGINTKTQTFTVSVAPSAPSAPDLTASSDTGTSTSDNITKATSLSFSGTGTLGDSTSTVRVFVDLDNDNSYDSGTEPSAIAVMSNGSWTTGAIDVSALADGSYKAYAFTTSSTGGLTSANSAATTFTVDRSAPTTPTVALAAASDSGSSSADKVTKITTPTFTGTADANMSVTVYDGATAVGSTTADSSGNWSVVSSTLASGSRSITAKATDVAGNVSTSTTLTVTIDTAAPTAPASLALAVGSDSGTSSSDRNTNVAQPTISGTAEANATIALFDGSTQVGSGTANGSGNWSITASTLSDGAHNITAKATDAAGNVSSASSTLVVTIDTTAPAQPAALALAVGSDSGSSSSDNVTSVTAPTISGTAEANATVTLYDGSTQIGTGTANGSGNWSITSSTLSSGSHNITAKATDAAGNVGIASSVLTVVVDTAAPSAPAALALAAGSDTGSSSSDRLTSATQPTINGTAEAGATVKLYDGATQVGTGTADSGGNWSITTSTLASGTHSITAKATDSAGNTSGASSTLSVTIDTAAPALPSGLALTTATDTGTSSTDNVTKLATPAVKGTAEANAAITLYDGTTQIGTGTADGSGNWSITTSTLTEGVHHISADATDAAGNASGKSSTVDVTVDLTAPTVVRVTSDKTAMATNDTATITFEFSEDPGTTFAWDGTSGDLAITGGTLSAISGTGTIRTATFQAGTGASASIAVSANSYNDLAGNAGSGGSVSIALDVTPPDAPPVPVLDPGSDSGTSGDKLTSVKRPTLTGTAEANATVKLYDSDGTTQIGTGSADGSGNWSITIASNLADGTHNITARAIDAAGNVSTASPVLALTIDTSTAAPTALALASGSDSGAAGDGVTSHQQPTVTGKAEAGATVTLFDGATQVGSGTADGSGNWSITTTGNLSDGPHNMTATAADAAGNTSGASTTLVVTIDTATPAAPANLALATDTGSSSTDKLTKVTQPTISGTAEANATITLFEGSTQVGSGTADGTGHWSITTSSALSDGLHSITATATDAANNVSGTSTALDVTIDSSVPAAPADLALATSSDSGSSHSDKLTSVTQPVISGTAEASSTVKLFDGATLVGTGTADTGGNWSITTSILADGAHNLTAQATDAAGNVSGSSAALTITIDASPPAAPTALALAAASDSGGSNSDRITSVVQPVIGGSAEAGATVDLYDGTTQIGSATADISGNWSVTASTLGDGTHNITAKATDAAGNVSAASSALVVTVDTAKPSAPAALALAAGSDSGTSGDNVTSVPRPAVSGTAEANAAIILYDGLAQIGSGTADGTGKWSITPGAALSDGSHNINATATDAAGNVSDVSGMLTVLIDTAAPAAPTALALATSSDSGSSHSDKLTSTTQPVISGTAEASSTVKLYDGATLVGTGTADSGGNWSITTNILADGAHNISAQATDAAGNVSGSSTALTITIDTAAPAAPTALALATASDSGASSSDRITSVVQPVIGGHAEAGATVDLFDGSTQIGSATADISGNWSITVSTLGDGAHNITAKATDAAGNVGSLSSALVVNIDTAKPLAPAALALAAGSDSGTSGDNVTSVPRPTVSGTAEANAAIILYDGLTQIGSGTADGTGKWSITPGSALSDGSHNINATATDAAGNVSDVSGVLTVLVDTAAPAAPTAVVLAAGSDTGISSSDGTIKLAQPTISGSAEAGATIKLYDGATLVGTGAADSGGSWSIVTNTLAEGAHTITATATDTAGNASGASGGLGFTVDKTAPTLSITTSKAALTIGETATITFTFSEDPDTSFDLGDIGVTGGSLSGLAPTGAVRTATFTPTPGTNGGSATISVLAGAYTDMAGNDGGAGTRSLTFDTLAPSAPSVPVLDSGSDSGIAGDNLTRNTTPHLDGTAEAGATVKLYDGATLVGSGTADGSGNWTITTGTLAEGSHTLTATATDVAGNTGAASSGLLLTVDTTPPVLAISSDKPTLRAGQTATITFTFSEDPGATFSWDGTSGDVSVSGGTLSAISGSGNTRTATFTPNANTNSGTASITVAGSAYTDAAGNDGAAGTTPSIHFDTLAPTVTIASDKPALKIGETATITFTFSEDPDTSFAWDGTSGDVSVTGGTLSAISGTGTVRTAVFTPDAGANGGAATISIAAAAYTDLAGNGGAGGTRSLTFDTLAPSAPSVPVLDSGSDSGIAGDNLTREAKPQLDGTAEAGATIKLYDGATMVGSGTADGSGNWTITTGTLAEGSHTLTATATDVAGNTGVASSGLVLNIDTTPPMLAISSDKPTLRAGQTATITFTFSEDPGATFSWDGTSGDVSVSGGTLSAISGSGNTRIATFTPSANTNTGTASITVAGSAYTDAAGNDGGAGSTPSIHFDTLAPTVTITSDKPALKIGETATITFTFSEDPGTSFSWDGTAGDVAVSGGTLSAIAGTGTVRTAVFTPAANTNGGVAGITIASGSYADAAGNNGAAGTTPSLHFDTLAPAAPSAPVLDSASDSGTSNADNLTSVTALKLNGSAEAGATVKLYDGATLVGSGTADNAGNWTVTTSALAAGPHALTATATDVAGNTGAASGALSVTIDTTAPALVISSDKPALKGGETATITFTFSEDPGATFGWDGASGDVSVSGGTLSAISGSGSVRTATFTPTAGINAGTASITVAGASYTDAAGNDGGAGTTPSIHFDTLAPTVAISSDKPSLKIGETATITFTFSEDPGTSFSWDGTSGDVTVSGGTLSAIAGSGTVRTAVFTPTANTNGGVASITVTDASYTDPAGNTGHAGATPGLVFDTLAPVAPSAPALAANSDSGSSHADGLTNAASLTFTGTAENGATVSVIDDTTKAVLGTGVATGGNWSIAVSSSAQPEGAFRVAAIATDAAGNAGVQSAATTVMLDRVAPGAPTLSLDVDSGVVGDGVTNVGRVKVQGFEAGATWEYSLDSGAHWQPGSGSIFQVPNPGNWTVTARQSDAAGNTSASGSPLNFTLLGSDAPPTSTISMSDTSLTNGETALVTIVFNTRVTGFTLADISAPNGTLSGLASSDGGRTWTVTFTPQAGVTAETNNISVNNAGVADAFGNTGAGTSTSPVYSVFTSGVSASITLSDTSLLAGETSQVTIVFSEAVNGFALSKLDAPNGKLSDLHGADGRTFTALFTPSAGISDATNVITLDNSSVVGAHGTHGSGTSKSANYVVDTIRPTATLSIADHLIAQGGKTTLTVKFSQPVTGFDAADLEVSHATLANLSSADGGLTWTATLTADSGGKAATPGRVALHLDGVHNAAGNVGSGLADAQFVVASANAKSTSVDGLLVMTDSFTDTSGQQEQVTMIPLVPAGRVDDASTAHGTLADIPLVPATAPGSAPVLSASLPVGAGMLVQGVAAPLPAADALADLVARISDKTGAGSSTQSDMLGSGQGFVAALGTGATIVSSTVVPTVSPGTTLNQPIVISGATPAPGTPGAPVVGLVIDATGLPSGSTLQLDNVDFAAVTGNVRLFGGLGQNYVVGDGGSQTIYLGPDDDILSGGGGNDFVGSAGGNDTLDGGDGDDLVAGGIGNDRVSGGSGDDMVNGGRSTVGSWSFFISASGVASARHDGAVFTLNGSETVQGAELDASVAELRFLKADPQKVAGIALLYAGLDRTPDLAGLSFWATSGASLADVARGVLASSEFGGGPLGQIDDASFVRGMYQHVLGRAAEDAAVAYWTARLSGSDGKPSASRADVLVAVALSDEHKAEALGASGYTVAQASLKQETGWFAGSGDDRLSGGPGKDLLVGGDGVDTVVYDGKASQYHITLGSDNAIHVVDTANGDVDTLSGIEKAEFKDGTIDLAFTAGNAAQLARVGLLFQAVLARPLDAAGLNGWVSNGMDATQLAQAIAGTAEFQSHYGGMSNAAFVQALYANSGLDASAAGGEQSWEAYLGSHTRAQLIASWITQDDVVHAQFGASGLWLV